MSENSEDQDRPDFTDSCKWCKKQGLMWILDHKKGTWFLTEQNGKPHIHQPQMENGDK